MTTPLDTRNEFIARHIGPRDADTQAMLDLLGHASLDALTDSVVPAPMTGHVKRCAYWSPHAIRWPTRRR